MICYGMVNLYLSKGEMDIYIRIIRTILSLGFLWYGIRKVNQTTKL